MRLTENQLRKIVRKELLNEELTLLGYAFFTVLSGLVLFLGSTKTHKGNKKQLPSVYQSMKPRDLRESTEIRILAYRHYYNTATRDNLPSRHKDNSFKLPDGFGTRLGSPNRSGADDYFYKTDKAPDGELVPWPKPDPKFEGEGAFPPMQGIKNDFLKIFIFLPDPLPDKDRKQIFAIDTEGNLYIRDF